MKKEWFRKSVGIMAAVLMSAGGIYAATESCEHRGKTNDRASDQDCSRCAADGTKPNAGASGGNCVGYHHDTINAWCKCQPNTQCVPQSTHHPNTSYKTSEIGTCDGNGSCSVFVMDQDANATLTDQDSQGCS